MKNYFLEFQRHAFGKLNLILYIYDINLISF